MSGGLGVGKVQESDIARMVNGTVSAGVHLPCILFGVRFRDYYCSTKSWTLRNFQTPLQATRHRSTGPFLCNRRCGFSLSRFWATPEEVHEVDCINVF